MQNFIGCYERGSVSRWPTLEPGANKLYMSSESDVDGRECGGVGASASITDSQKMSVERFGDGQMRCLNGNAFKCSLIKCAEHMSTARICFGSLANPIMPQLTGHPVGIWRAPFNRGRALSCSAQTKTHKHTHALKTSISRAASRTRSGNSATLHAQSSPARGWPIDAGAHVFAVNRWRARRQYLRGDTLSIMTQ